MASSRDAYSQAMKEGRAQAWAMNWQAAAEQYRLALKEFPEDAVARNSLAVTLYRAGDWENALTEYEMVGIGNPQDLVAKTRIAELHGRLGNTKQCAKGYVALAQLFLDQRDREKALEAWNKAIEQCSEDAEALAWVGSSAGQAGELSLQAEVEARLASMRKKGVFSLDSSSSSGESQTVESEAESVSVVNDTSDSAEETEVESSIGETGIPDSSDGASIGEGMVGFDVATRAIVSNGLSVVEAYVKAGHYCAAEDECLRLISLVPGCLPIHAALADTYAKQRLLDEAVEKYTLIASLYDSRGDLAGSALTFRRMLELQPVDLAKRQQLSSLLLRAGLKEDAQAELLTLAEEYLGCGFDEKSLGAFRQAIEIGPETADLYRRYGRALGILGGHRKAVEAFTKAIELDPSDPTIMLYLSGELACEGDWEAVGAIFASLTKSATEDAIFLDAALSYYQNAVASKNDSAALHYCLGTMLRIANRRNEARVHLEAAAQMEGQSDARCAIACHLFLADDLLREGTFSVVEQHLRQGLSLIEANCDVLSEAELFSMRIDYWRLAADSAASRKNWREAASALNRIKAFSPKDLEVRSRLAEAYFRLGEVTATCEEFTALAEILVENDQNERAVAVYQAIIQLDPGNLNARMKLAGAYQKIGAQGDALSELNGLASALEARGDIEGSYRTLGTMLEMTRGHDPNQAMLLRERMVKLNPSDFALRKELVDAYLKAGRPSQAMDEARGLAEALCKVGRFEDAAGAFRQVLVLDPWNVGSLERLGETLCRLGDWGEAAKVFERILAIQPDNAQAKSAIAAVRQRR